VNAERGEGGGKEFERVLEELRARIANGTYALNTSLPTQRALADKFEVSRDTVQRVLRELKNEGWIESRQGSGSRVVKQPIHSATHQQAAPRQRAALGPFMARAFAQQSVQLDVFTLTSESLDAHIRLQAERIRMGRAHPENGEVYPERIELRLLLPSVSLTLPYPRVKRTEGNDDGESMDELQDQLQQRLWGITRRHTSSLRAALRDLQTEGLVPSVSVQVRHVPLAPAFKLYLRRNTEALFGPYEVVERPILLEDGTEVEAQDVLGLGSTLTRFVNDEGDPDSPGSVFIESMQAWFDSCWTMLAETA
jgi:DNA-binding transcriptional regulator YhcF (GntR family)